MAQWAYYKSDKTIGLKCDTNDRFETSCVVANYSPSNLEPFVKV